MNNDYQIKESHQYISQKKYADAWYRYNEGIVCTYIYYLHIGSTYLSMYVFTYLGNLLALRAFKK